MEPEKDKRALERNDKNPNKRHRGVASSESENKTGEVASDRAHQSESEDEAISDCESPAPEIDTDEENDLKYRELSLDVYDVTRKIETLSQYPSTPLVHFAQESAKIALSSQGSVILRAMLTCSSGSKPVPPYLPKDLADICVSYYEENVKTFIRRTLEDFQIFASGKLIDRLVNNLSVTGIRMRTIQDFQAFDNENIIHRLTNQTPPSERMRTTEYFQAFKSKTAVDRLVNGMPLSDQPRLARLLNDVHDRGPAYLWWFHVRMALPLCIPLDTLIMRQEGKRIHFVLENGKDVASMCFHEPGNTLYVRLPDERVNCEDYGPLVDSVPHPDLIGPSLNTSTVTIEQLRACSQQLGPSRKIQDRWFASLLNMHRAYAAIAICVSNVESFEYGPATFPDLANLESRLEWNEFHKKYQCGEVFSFTLKSEADYRRRFVTDFRGTLLHHHNDTLRRFDKATATLSQSKT